MPVNVKDLLRSVEGSNHSDSASEALAAMNPLREILEEQQAHWNKSAIEAFSSKIRVDAERMRAEAEARQVNRDIRELTINGNEERQRLREEVQRWRTVAEAAQRDSWRQLFVGAIVGATMGAVATWLLGLLNAGHLLSLLPHP